MILALGILSFLTADAQPIMKGLTRSERSFVNNVIKVQKEKPLQVTKRSDDHIVVQFESTMVLLRPDGFIGEMWILGDGDWLSLGTEQDAY